MKTTDGGENWELQESFRDVILYNLDFVNGGLGWAVGRDGTILRYDGVLPINNIDQEFFEISVYPNPVNSQNTFTIESAVAIRNIQIIEVMGRQLSSDFYLDVSANKLTGQIESSGVYFIQVELEIGKLITKRVVVTDRIDF